MLYVLCLSKFGVQDKNKQWTKKKKVKKEPNTQKKLQINCLEPEICLNYPYKAILKTRMAGTQLISCISGIAPAVQNDSCFRVT